MSRGDQFQISASAFNHASEPPESRPSLLDSPRIMRIAQLLGGVILLIIAAIALGRMRGLASATRASHTAMLQPGARVGELEAMMDQNALPAMRPAAVAAGQIDPNIGVRDRARELARNDPARAAHLLKAWINTDSEQRS